MPFYPGKSCFSFGEGNQSGQLLLWMLTRDTVSSKCQTHSRANIILISHLCFLFPLNHSPSRSLWSLAALPSLTPLLSAPLPSKSFIACFCRSPLQALAEDLLTSSWFFFQLRHICPYGAWSKQNPTRHLKQDHEELVGMFMLSSLGSLSPCFFEQSCHWFPWSLFITAQQESKQPLVSSNLSLPPP